MTQRIITCSMLLLWIALAPNNAFAQEDTGADDESEEESAEEVEVVDPLIKAREKGGDIIIMKSGAIMSGVQIIRRTPVMYMVELIPGSEPMGIPRRYVKAVEFDDIDPEREKRRRSLMPKPEVVLMADGKELDPEFDTKLRTPIPGIPMTWNDEDFVQVFKLLQNKTGVIIVVDPSLMMLPPAKRVWTLKTTAESTLMDILRKKWTAAFPYGEITFERDKVVLKLKTEEPSINGVKDLRTPKL